MKQKPKTNPVVFWKIGWILAVIASFTSGALLIASTSSGNLFRVYSYLLDVIIFDLLAVLVFNNPRIGSRAIVAYCVVRLLSDAACSNEAHALVLFVMALGYIVISLIAKKPEKMSIQDITHS